MFFFGKVVVKITRALSSLDAIFFSRFAISTFILIIDKTKAKNIIEIGKTIKVGVIKLILNKYIRMIIEMTKINNLRNEIRFNIVNYDVTLSGELNIKKNLRLQFVVPEKYYVENIYYTGEFGELQSLEFKTRNIKKENIKTM